MNGLNEFPRKIPNNIKSYLVADDTCIHVISTHYMTDGKRNVLYVLEDAYHDYSIKHLYFNDFCNEYAMVIPNDIILKEQTLLEHAYDILHKRSEEKERQYGPMTEGMEKAAKIAALLSGKEFDARMMYIAMVSLKLSRESYSKKYDNILDTIVYMAAMVDADIESYTKSKK